MIVAALTLSHVVAWAGITGMLKGRVTDKETTQPLPGVNVVVMGTVVGAATDVNGNFQISSVRAGVYSVRFSIIGYKTVIMEQVAILPDRQTQFDMDMEPTAVELAPVEVVYQRPLIQKDQPVTAYSIGEFKIEKLPVSTFREILTLQPGTTLEGNVRGGKTTEALFLVDGLPAQDVIGGGLGVDLPRSSITGLTVYTGGFEAEYGNALSGVVNVVTRAGGDRHTANVRLERDGWLPTSINKQQDRATQVELTAGGPIIRERLTYFTANTFTMSDTRWWQDFDGFFSSPVQREFTGFSRLEFLSSPSFRIGLQGIYSLRSWRDHEFSWRYNLDGLPSRSRDAFRTAIILSNTVSPHSSYTVSLSTFYHRSRIGEGAKEDQVLQPYGYDFYLRYVLEGKRNWWADARQVVYTLKTDYTTQVNEAHLLRLGLELNQYDVFSDLVKYEPQRTYFGKPILDAPLLSYGNSFHYFPRSGGLYVQDKIDLEKDGSMLSAGLRWDFLDPRAERPIVEFIPGNPGEYHQQITGEAPAKFKHQISPRIAFSAPLSPNTFVFANVGKYFQFPLFEYLYSGINPAQVREGTRSVLAGNPDLEPERTLQWEVGIKQSLLESFVGSATYFKKEFQNQIDAKTLIPFDSKAAGDYGFASYVNNAAGSAWGIELMLSRERDESISGSLSYSYMVTEGTSEYANQTINYAQWGFPLAPKPFPLSWDQRHTVKVDVEAKTLWDVQTNLVVLYNSPRPYTYYPTRDGFTSLDTSYMFVPNNARMSDVLFVNLKVSKQFRLSWFSGATLTLYADGRNLLDRQNVRWVDSNGRIGGELSDPSAYYEPRRVRVGMRLEF